MRIHWGFKEEIHRLLSEAALAIPHSNNQEQLLNEACILLWRFDSAVIPRSASDILPLLSRDISTWLPKSVDLLYKGALISSDAPTMLPETILIDISGDALTRRDQLVSDILNQKPLSDTKAENFRHLVTTEAFKGSASSSNVMGLNSTLTYEPIPLTRYNDHVYICRECLYPMDIHREYLTCASPYCSNTNYAITPNHEPVPYSRKKKPLIKLPKNDMLKLTHLAWRTIATPFQLERRVINYFKKVLPAAILSTLQPIQDRPGITLLENEKRVHLEPIATHSAVTIENYYSELDNSDATWLIVPDGTRRLFGHLKARLPENYRIVTSRSYPYEYLSEFHNAPKRGGKRIRCQ